MNTYRLASYSILGGAKSKRLTWGLGLEGRESRARLSDGFDGDGIGPPVVVPSGVVVVMGNCLVPCLAGRR